MAASTRDKAFKHSVPSSNAGSCPSKSYFDFFALSPNIRDLMYEQPQLLHNEVVVRDTRNDPEDSAPRGQEYLVVTKLRLSLL
jgi:hypothetical protein